MKKIKLIPVCFLVAIAMFNCATHTVANVKVGKGLYRFYNEDKLIGSESTKVEYCQVAPNSEISGCKDVKLNYGY